MKQTLFAAAALLAVVAATGSARAAGDGPVDVNGAAGEASHPSGLFVRPGVPHPGSDQIWWVPTFAQAEAVGKATGRMILVMGSIADWNGY